MLPDPVAAILPVVTALESLGVRYFIGGSLASSVHGVARATLDADLVAELEPQHAEPFVEALGESFYVDVDAVKRALDQRRSFNVIYLPAMFKVDVFPTRQRYFDQICFARRAQHVLSENPPVRAFFASAEDVLLAKLEWYRQGGEVSDRQWRDILGILHVRGQNLDREYLRHWAGRLDVADLLECALGEAAVDRV